MPVKIREPQEIAVTFSGHELAQIEAFATLHGESIAAFVRNAALMQAQVTPKIAAPSKADASWMEESFAGNPAPGFLAEELFAPQSLQPAGKQASSSAPILDATAVSNRNRGTAGVASTLARGSGLVWEIRQSLARERVHGLGWTREQLAFVLKMSVVGVRKMEHLGKTPSKNPESRRALLTLAQTLESPSLAIAAWIASETAGFVTPK